MGDAADDCFDLALQQQVEHDNDVAYWMQQKDSVLKLATAKSRKPIIVSIRQQRNLSHKQRLVLARYIANKQDDS